MKVVIEIKEIDKVLFRIVKTKFNQSYRADIWFGMKFNSSIYIQRVITNQLNNNEMDALGTGV